MIPRQERGEYEKSVSHGRDMMRTQKGFYSEEPCLAKSMDYTSHRFPAGNPVLVEGFISVKRTPGDNAKIRGLVLREYRTWKTEYRKVGIRWFSTIASLPGKRKE